MKAARAGHLQTVQFLTNKGYCQRYHLSTAPMTEIRHFIVLETFLIFFTVMSDFEYFCVLVPSQERTSTAIPPTTTTPSSHWPAPEVTCPP